MSLKRVKAIDAMRGIGLLGMIPFHMILFGALWGGVGEGNWGSETIALPVVEFNPPLATGLIIFFFVTGMSLAVSLSRRRERETPFMIGRHVLFRYGGYILIGVVFELLLWVVIRGPSVLTTNLIRTLVNIMLGATFSGPIIGLGLGAIIGFPLILKASWQKLASISLGLAVLIGIVLQVVLLPRAEAIPSVSILSLLITGMYSVLKGLPIILLGGAMGKWILEGGNLRWVFLVIGGIVTTAYMIVPTMLGTGMLHMILAVWAYPHAILFVTGSSVFIITLFRMMEDRKRALSPLTVLGRSPLLVYYGHFVLFFALIALVGTENLSMTMLGNLIVVVIAIIWILSYLYGRWRWGSPVNW